MTRKQKEIQCKLQIERQVLSAQLQKKQYLGTNGPLNPVDIQMHSRLEVRLASVERAILRLEKGAFGTCQSCGEEIDSARLEALPTAEQCIDCQRKLEQKVVYRYAYA